jgi:site-specific DNA-methyltransferase (adenine-specific)
VTIRRIIQGESLEVLARLDEGSVDLIYIDPPFNTRSEQKRTTVRVTRDETGGDRRGFHGHLYSTEVVGTHAFDDRFDDLPAFLEPRFHEAYRVLSPRGSMFVHLDYREVHYCKVSLDGVFGRRSFLNEIIWAYDFGGRTQRRWPPKHDNILWYVKDPAAYTFHYDQVDRVPYLAPGLVSAEKAQRGKALTDVWWNTIVPTKGHERTGYPTQKPLGIIRRIVRVHSNPGDVVLDFFAGSGTLGVAAAELERGFILVDSNPEAVGVMKERLAFANPSVEVLGAADPVSRAGDE